MVAIIYQDNSILVINKPAGLSSLPDGYDPTLPHVRSLLEPEFGRLWMVHRLDKETSGILVLARSTSAHKYLNDQFANREIQKVYSALVNGVFPQTLSINFPLKINGDRRHRTILDEKNGKLANTDFQLADVYSCSTSLINAFPHTGYTHQIRSHLLSAGFPILGDPLYYTPDSKIFSAQLPIQRTALHAQQITFLHPDTQIKVTFSADLPQDFLDTIAYFK
jgi:RluA family pseudouridine synthase